MVAGIKAEEVTLILTMAENRLIKTSIRVRVKTKDIPLMEMAFQTLMRKNQGFSWRIVESQT